MRIKLRKEDILFSQIIRSRDKWTCVFCKKKYTPPTQGLQCSHFWGRARENTRFDLQNCDSLCFSCHQFLGGDGREEYISFKKQQLGEKDYQKLKLRAHIFCKKDSKLILLYLKELKNKLGI